MFHFFVEMLCFPGTQPHCDFATENSISTLSVSSPHCKHKHSALQCRNSFAMGCLQCYESRVYVAFSLCKTSLCRLGASNSSEYYLSGAHFHL